MKALSDWVGIFALYRGSDPFLTMAAAGYLDGVRNYLAEFGLTMGDIQRHENGGCWVCGQLNYNHYVIAARFDEDSDRPVELIEVGHICADQLGMDAVERKYLRQAEALRAEAFANEAFEHHGLTEVLELARAGSLSDWGNETVIDIWNYARRRSTLSDRQVELVKKIHQGHLDWKARQEAPKVPKVPAPISDDRQRIEGTVLSVKGSETMYGFVVRMTIRVETEDGAWTAWGTAPSAIVNNVDRGDRVAFTAKIVEADWADDESFAKFSRPTKAEILAKETVAA